MREFTASNGLIVGPEDPAISGYPFRVGACPFAADEFAALREFFAWERDASGGGRVLLQTEETGTGEWFTITEYVPGTDEQWDRANSAAAVLFHIGLHARVKREVYP